MKKLVNVLLYSLLLAVTLAGTGAIRYFIIQDKDRAANKAQQLAAEAEQKKEISNTGPALAKDRGIVLVKRLPVYEQKKIAKAEAEADRAVLSYQEEVTILRQEGRYTKIRTNNGTTGYVWSDCIEEAAALDMQPQQQRNVIVIDVAVQEQEAADKETACTELCLRIAGKLEKKLEKRGYLVVMAVREPEYILSDAKSAELSNGILADAVIHICVGEKNQNPNQSVDKTAVYYIPGGSKYPASKWNADSRQLGKQVLASYTKTTGFESAGMIQYDGYKRMRLSKRPVILLKMGELANEEQAAQMQKPKFQAKMAKGIADGIDTYFEKISTDNRQSE